MKILAVPDPHCWYDLYSEPGEGGIPSRLSDWRRTAAALVDLAVREEVVIAVAPGDYFVSGKPPARAIIEVAGLFAALEAAGVPTVGCNGNHDVAGPGQPGPVDVIASLGTLNWGITRPQRVHLPTRDGSIQVAVLPWAKSAGLVDGSEGAGDLVQRTTEALVSIVRSLAAQVDPYVPAILIGHWAVSGCTMSSGQLLTGGEPALPLAELQAGPWRAVIMGHIHRPQVFPGRPVTLHTGALTRRDFGEEHDPRGAYIIDLDTGEATWHELPARRFWTLPLGSAQVEKLAHGADLTERYVLHPNVLTEAAGAICRVKYRATEEQHRQIDQAALVQALREAGAAHVAGVYPEIIRGDRSRAEGLTEQTSPLDALDQWLALRTEYSEELLADVRREAAALMGEVS